MPLPKQAVSFRQLRSEGLTKKEILSMCASLSLFPTPFKGIYYVPLEEERKGAFIEKPLKALSQAITLFLGSDDFYFSCRTAEEALGLNWHPSGSVHIVNRKLSRRIDLKARMGRSQAKRSWRAGKIAILLAFYGNELVFHKGDVAAASTKQTPYGRFASRSQIKADRKRFREK
jgi:hypothetical protein